MQGEGVSHDLIRAFSCAVADVVSLGIAGAALPADASDEKFSGEQCSDRDKGADLGVLPARCALPVAAARVRTSEVLDEHFSQLAAVARDPSLVMRSPLSFEGKVTSVFSRVGSTCGALVEHGVDVGLLELLEEQFLITIDCEQIVGGVFAVPKDDVEDRWLSPLERTNELLMTEKIPSVVYPYIPSLAVAPKCSVIRSGKRDARHYYPSLFSDGSGRLWLVGPPVAALEGLGGFFWPTHRSWPMGLRMSCALAHGVTDCITLRAGLSEGRGATPLRAPPRVPAADDDSLCSASYSRATRWLQSAVGSLGYDLHALCSQPSALG